ncbi:MAG: DUF1365 domain-containing protein [Candidatus Binatia bacterium]|nr:MAG: DUF1365 domain-containing protein [Candidatus Binatia bacterium]
MKSALYFGWVQHVRHHPQRHRFRYRSAFFYLDLHELPILRRRLWLLGVNRPGLFSLRESDFLDGRGLSVERLKTFVAQQGLPSEAIAATRLLTHVRQWGYVFNPISLFFCFSRADELLYVVAEVNNTFGERFHYVLSDLSHHGGNSVFFAKVEKHMHVSPFASRDGCHYEFRFRPPADRFSLAIRLREQDRPVIDAALWAERHPLSDRTLLRLAARHPWLTAKVTLAIHWEALKLYRKGLPFFSQPPPSPAQAAQQAIWQRSNLHHEQSKLRFRS